MSTDISKKCKECGYCGLVVALNEATVEVSCPNAGTPCWEGKLVLSREEFQTWWAENRSALRHNQAELTQAGLHPIAETRKDGEWCAFGPPTPSSTVIQECWVVPALSGDEQQVTEVEANLVAADEQFRKFLREDLKPVIDRTMKILEGLKEMGPVSFFTIDENQPDADKGVVHCTVNLLPRYPVATYIDLPIVCTDCGGAGYKHDEDMVASRCLKCGIYDNDSQSRQAHNMECRCKTTFGCAHCNFRGWDHLIDPKDPKRITGFAPCNDCAHTSTALTELQAVRYHIEDCGARCGMF